MLVGFCGTDREIVHGQLGRLPPGSDHLVLGHEMVGVVAEVGDRATDLRPGQLVTAMVRSACRRCVPCALGRPDYCLSGQYSEFGIAGLDGFAQPAINICSSMVVPVPREVASFAVLTEPLAVVVKALDQASTVLARIPGRLSDTPRWGEGLHAVVAGAGTIGVLSTYLLSDRGFTVTTLDVQPAGSAAARLVQQADAQYVQVSSEDARSAAQSVGPADVVLEATGDARLAFELLRTLAPGAVMVWIGSSGHDGRAAESFDIGRAQRRAVANHHAVIGTVNASRSDFAEAIKALGALTRRAGFAGIITSVLPPERFAEAIAPRRDAIKQVVAFDWRG